MSRTKNILADARQMYFDKRGDIYDDKCLTCDLKCEVIKSCAYIKDEILRADGYKPVSTYKTCPKRLKRLTRNDIEKFGEVK